MHGVRPAILRSQSCQMAPRYLGFARAGLHIKLHRPYPRHQHTRKHPPIMQLFALVLASLAASVYAANSLVVNTPYVTRLKVTT